MIAELKDNIKHVVILDVSEIYARIYNDGYFEENTVESIQQQYSDSSRWRVLVLD